MYLCLADNVDPVEIEDTHTSKPTGPKQQPFKRECNLLAYSVTHISSLQHRNSVHTETFTLIVVLTAMLLFEQAMKEGYIEVSIIKCLLLGTAGVSKTCLLHLLLGMLPPQL